MDRTGARIIQNNARETDSIPTTEVSLGDGLLMSPRASPTSAIIEAAITSVDA
jgi:hypothetical protein